MMINNAVIYSVSEISQNVKKTLETAFGYVHVRGELTEVKRAASGHIYATMKDKDAVLNVIVWKTSAGRLQAQPEDGLEVIATGRMTTYPGRSNYQLIVDQMEVAGEGALLKLIEERRKKLAAEGLFDAERKRDLPAFPRRIAVITSPTGAVIRDILHRLEERWPCEVLLLPVLVQGEGAAQQIASAINAVSRLADMDTVIVARGGGSLEDLMAFNDEAVVRAAANCPVPLISAVGHETDTTLIDWASDKRAPTPTAAAEFATPHRGALLDHLHKQGQVLARTLERRAENDAQKLDHLGFQLARSVTTLLERNATKLAGFRLRSPLQILDHQDKQVAQQGLRLLQAVTTIVDRNAQRLPDAQRLVQALDRTVERKTQTIASLARILETTSFKSVLDRGFALVRNEAGKPITTASALASGQSIQLDMKDGQKAATIT